MEDIIEYKTKTEKPEISGDYWYDKFVENQEIIASLHGDIQELKKALRSVIDHSNKCTYYVTGRDEFNAHAALIAAIDEAKELLKL